MFNATPATSLRDYLELFYLTARNLRPDTRTEYLVQVANLERFWADYLAERSAPSAPLTLADLSDELVYAAMSWQLARGREAETANKLRAHVNALWRAAHEAGLVARLPKNKKYRVNRKDPIALLPDELDRLLAAAAARTGTVGCEETGDVPAGQWWLTAVLFIYSLGSRISAAYYCPTANLDLERCEVLLPAAIQKQRRDQRLDLLPGVVYWLRELRLAERRVSTVLGDFPFKIRTLRKDYTRLFVEAGLYAKEQDVPKKLKFHALRKTLASQLYAAGGMPVACERLGHSSPQVTERYIDPRYKQTLRLAELIKDPSPKRLPTPTLKLYRDAAG